MFMRRGWGKLLQNYDFDKPTRTTQNTHIDKLKMSQRNDGGNDLIALQCK